MVEIVAELVVGIGLVGVAYAVGSIVYLQYRVARRSLRHLAGTEPVVDPQGGHWTVRVALAPPPLRLTMSRWYFGMRTSDQQERTRAGVAADGVTKKEVAHPSQLVERFDEMAGIVVWAVLLATLVAVAVLLLEVLVVAVVATAVFAFRALRGRWQCEVVPPSPPRRPSLARACRVAVRRPLLARRHPRPAGRRPHPASHRGRAPGSRDHPHRSPGQLTRPRPQRTGDIAGSFAGESRADSWSRTAGVDGFSTVAGI